MKRMHIDFARVWFDLARTTHSRKVRQGYDRAVWASLLEWAAA